MYESSLCHLVAGFFEFYHNILHAYMHMNESCHISEKPPTAIHWWSINIQNMTINSNIHVNEIYKSILHAKKSFSRLCSNPPTVC